jgi:riboflavin biosynthesis pyrimidine reductase
MDRLRTLFDAHARATEGMPEYLRRLYGGDLWLGERVVYGNFVTSMDGVAAVRSELRSSAIISRRNPGDRLVMGLLRAWADVVLIGAGTFRAHPGGMWTPSRAYPPASDHFRELRERAGLTIAPHLAVLSASGELDVREPSLQHATIITTESSKDGLERELPESAIVLALADTDLGPAAAVELLRSRGHHRILTEGGPNVMAGLIEARVMNELFLTISPLLIGRDGATARPGIIDGVALEPEAFVGGTLKSVRVQGSHLFLRYELLAD